MVAHQRSLGERTFDAANTILLALLALITIYPFLYILGASFSSEDALARQQVILWPVGFTLDSYKIVFSTDEVLLAYGNTIFYTVVGTFLNVLMTTAAAYPLSRKGYSLRSPLMIFLVITMYFSGGLIPFYLLVNQLGLINTRWAVIIPGAVSAWYLLLARVFFQSTIPEELTDAAKVDGANDVVIFFSIVLPLSMPIVAVLALYYGVGHWNDFWGPLIFLNDPNLEPLSLYLRKILILSYTYGGETSSADILRAWASMALVERVKYASIIVTLVPIILTYPFLQRYFVKGVMIGALKE